MFVAQLRRVGLAVLLASPLATFAGCLTPHYPPGADNEHLKVGRLNTVRPIEIAVPPVANQTGDSTLPLAEFRAELQRGLVRRRYTPIAMPYVDRNVNAVDASYRPGASGEQAVLSVTLTGWDTSRWQSHASLKVEADVYLLDATNPDPQMALWGGPVTRNVDLSAERNSFINDDAMLRRAVEVAVAGILASLPAREIE